MRPCKNPLCLYWLIGSAQYCCQTCWKADAGKYEIHEDGPLGHTELCARRDHLGEEHMNS